MSYLRALEDVYGNWELGHVDREGLIYVDPVVKINDGSSNDYLSLFAGLHGIDVVYFPCVR